MTEPSVPTARTLEDPLAEALRIVAAADAKGLLVRLMGGMAVRAHSPEWTHRTRRLEVDLDSESERLIQASMKELLQGRTTFVIAHRLSTVRDADLIVVLDHGKIREAGTHAELMKQRGTYRAMVELQLERPEEQREGAMDWSLAAGAG